MLAGNFFDWGAKEITTLLEGPHNFGFHEARNKLESRPWLIDGVDQWMRRIKLAPPHKCAIIFVDNSGFDFVLGVLPMVRWFLRRGTEVLITFLKLGLLYVKAHPVDLMTGYHCREL